MLYLYTFCQGVYRQNIGLKLVNGFFDIVCAHLPPPAGEGLSLLPNFQKGGGSLTGSQFLEGGCWERGGVTFFMEGCSFYIKSKLKSEIFNDKKVYKQKNVFLCLD